jgi:hypothetical protein
MNRAMSRARITAMLAWRGDRRFRRRALRLVANLRTHADLVERFRDEMIERLNAASPQDEEMIRQEYVRRYEEQWLAPQSKGLYRLGTDLGFFQAEERTLWVEFNGDTKTLRSAVERFREFADWLERSGLD